VTACTGIDALAHALETAVTNKRNPLSVLFAKEAFALCHAGFERVLKKPKDLEARGMMLLGAAYAGTAIENSMLGAAHSCANPLTAKFGVVHGEAVGVMLPHVIRYNATDPDVAAIYESLYDGDLALRMQDLLRKAKMPVRIRAHGVTKADVPVLAEMAAKQWTAQFNPRVPSLADFEALYRAAL
jgi:alcohol dehydrogenase